MRNETHDAAAVSSVESTNAAANERVRLHQSTHAGAGLAFRGAGPRRRRPHPQVGHAAARRQRFSGYPGRLRSRVAPATDRQDADSRSATRSCLRPVCSGHCSICRAAPMPSRCSCTTGGRTLLSRPSRTSRSDSTPAFANLQPGYRFSRLRTCLLCLGASRRPSGIRGLVARRRGARQQTGCTRDRETSGTSRGSAGSNGKLSGIRPPALPQRAAQAKWHSTS